MIKIACHGIQAIINAFNKYPLDPSQSQYDLLRCIRRQLQHPPLKWIPRHFKGHTKNQRDHILDRWEEHNNEMDTAAKEDHQNAKRNIQTQTMLCPHRATNET
jgi:hypothetical protein